MATTTRAEYDASVAANINPRPGGIKVSKVSHATHAANTADYIVHNMDNNVTPVLTISGLQGASYTTISRPKLVTISNTSPVSQFYYDASDTTTADNGTTVLVTTAGLRYKKLVSSGGGVTEEQMDTAIEERAAPLMTVSELGAKSFAVGQVPNLVLIDYGTTASAFYWDPTDTTSSHDGVTVIVATSMQRYKRVRGIDAEPIYNVLDFGAKADGVYDPDTSLLTNAVAAFDNTAAFQAAYNFCHDAGGGIVKVPDGYGYAFVIKGTPVTSTGQGLNPNSILYHKADKFKNDDNAGSMKRRVVKVMGSSAFNPAPVQYFGGNPDYDDVPRYNTGSILHFTYVYSGATSTTALLPSCIGTIGFDATTRSFSYTGIIYENITIRRARPAGHTTINGFNGFYMKGLQMKNCAIDSEGLATTLTPPMFNTIGLVCPQMDCEMWNQFENIFIGGGDWIGLMIWEHVSGTFNIFNSWQEMAKGGGHQACVNLHLVFHGFRTGIVMGGDWFGGGISGGGPMEGTIKAEINHSGQAPADYNYVETIKDPSNTGTGYFRIAHVKSGLGAKDSAAVYTGGIHFKLDYINARHPNGFDTGYTGPVDDTWLNSTFTADGDTRIGMKGFVVRALSATNPCFAYKMDNSTSGVWAKMAVT